jgi:hypothetical protein
VICIAPLFWLLLVTSFFSAVLSIEGVVRWEMVVFSRWAGEMGDEVVGF